MRLIRTLIVLVLLVVLLVVLFTVYALATTPRSGKITYGVSFNTLYAHELGLSWKDTYTAILDDLKVRHLRLAAHWPMVEPTRDTWNWNELDTQVAMAQERDADVILAVGRRLPRWPECHVPDWASSLSWEEQKNALRKYIREVVTRYRDRKAVVSWQVENEPFLTVYAKQECGDLDAAFLDEEIALVHTLDPTRPVLVTDSGNLGTWYGAYQRGDMFGTSVYVYLWNEATGPFRTFLPPETYIVKRSLMQLLFGKKDSILIELSIEPWLNKPVEEADLTTQFSRMSIGSFDEILTYAAKTRLTPQYLWGAEWWYWLKQEKGHPEYWERAKKLYTISTQ